MIMIPTAVLSRVVRWCVRQLTGRVFINGDSYGFLIRCDKCGGSGILHDPVNDPITVQPMPDPERGWAHPLFIAGCADRYAGIPHASHNWVPLGTSDWVTCLGTPPTGEPTPDPDDLNPVAMCAEWYASQEHPPHDWRMPSGQAVHCVGLVPVDGG